MGTSTPSNKNPANHKTRKNQPTSQSINQHTHTVKEGNKFCFVEIKSSRHSTIDRRVIRDYKGAHFGRLHGTRSSSSPESYQSYGNVIIAINDGSQGQCLTNIFVDRTGAVVLRYVTGWLHLQWERLDIHTEIAINNGHGHQPCYRTSSVPVCLKTTMLVIAVIDDVGGPHRSANCEKFFQCNNN